MFLSRPASWLVVRFIFTDNVVVGATLPIDCRALGLDVPWSIADNEVTVPLVSRVATDKVAKNLCAFAAHELQRLQRGQRFNFHRLQPMNEPLVGVLRIR